MRTKSLSVRGQEERVVTNSVPIMVSSLIAWLTVGPVSTAKKQGYAMSLWLHGKEDYISEAGAMNMFVIKQADDGCE